MIFDINDQDISALGDADLRTLVALLGKAALRQVGLPTSGVTWGGNQDAADGGVDVRIECPGGSAIEGYVPRPATVFQTKKPDMPPGAILDEMCPGGALRPVIIELAATGGAYVIASSAASLSDAQLRRRRQAMRAALAGQAGTDAVLVDFYDRRRLADWVSEHPGMVAWVREHVGRPLQGWKPHGSWTSVAGAGGEYLWDDGVRFREGRAGSAPDGSGTGVLGGIGRVRSSLRVPGASVRLVGRREDPVRSGALRGEHRG